MIWELFLNYLTYFGISKIKNNGFWRPWTRPLGPKIMNIISCLTFLPKVKSKNYWSKMKRNNSTELLGQSFIGAYNKNGPPDPTQTPNLNLSMKPPCRAPQGESRRCQL